ncbi:MAG: hypothetical protein DMF86_02065 [Acidobacteria bacterium]|nr:MAG: hypothetical protein DMF86_02065 [Acidobacteriota bacterium]
MKRPRESAVAPLGDCVTASPIATGCSVIRTVARFGGVGLDPSTPMSPETVMPAVNISARPDTSSPSTPTSADAHRI